MRLLSNSWVLVGLAGVLWALPALAHKTEISGDVAGIWHLEPNHSPKAGEPAQVWVALTQQGGKVIPLEQCDCRLAIFKAGENGDAPVLQPELEPISAENFQGIPGAEVNFPEIGEYRLILTGRPQGEATFTPFELSYTTVVATGRDPTTNTAPQTESVERATPPNHPSNAEAPQTVVAQDTSTQTETPSKAANSANRKILWLAGGIGFALAALAIGALRLRAQQMDS
jgi:hypothetical protein